MNRYVNKKTGAEVLTECVLSGGDWEIVEEPKPAEAPKEPEPAPKKSTKRVKK